MVLTLTAAADNRYLLSIAQPGTHYCEVEATFPREGQEEFEIMLPVWTPGSYMVREYSRHLEAMEARDSAGNLIPLEKTRKNRWRVKSAGGGPVTVRYLVYGREMSVRNNWIENEFAMINGAPTFVVPVGGLAEKATVEFKLPAGWQAYSGLTREAGAFVATDYDELVDSPFLLGTPAKFEFTVGGKPHFLLNVGDDGFWDGSKAALDLQKIVETQRQMWGELPYRQYLFMNLLTDARGGLEHRNSTLVMSHRFAQRKRTDYLSWLGLMAHEYFHVWNVKRLRPEALGPFDYENEVYTRSLWVAEGITSYYDDLMVRRAGLSTTAEYLEALGKSIDRLQTTPGREVRSLSESSYDAWIKLYRPDENSVNTNISYYTKGLLVAFLLDVEIRSASQGAKNLDDVMRLAYARFQSRGFQEPEFRSLIEEVAGTSLTDFFRAYVDGTEELNYEKAFKYYGLRFQPVDQEEHPPGWTGLITTSDKKGRLLIKEIPRDAAAYGLGFQVGDELLAVDGIRVMAGEWKDRMTRYRPDDRVGVTVARRRKLLTVPMTLADEPGKRFRVEIDPKATAEQNRRRDLWLGAGGS